MSDIHNYIAMDDPDAADRVESAFEACRDCAALVEIVRLLHGARDLRSILN